MATTLHEAEQALDQPNDGSDDTPLEPDAEKGALFTAADYDREDLAIPKIDGNAIDKIRVAFSGSIMLDRSDPADVALFNRLDLGKDCDLRVSGKVSGTGAGFTTSKDGDLDAVVGQKTVKVDTVWVLEPEQL